MNSQLARLSDDELTGLVALVCEQVRLLAWRRHASQAQLADACGVSQSTLSKKLHGSVVLTLGELLCLAHALDVSAAELMVTSELGRRKMRRSRPLTTPLRQQLDQDAEEHRRRLTRRDDDAENGSQ